MKTALRVLPENVRTGSRFIDTMTAVPRVGMTE